jgi:hypothetical protein
VTVAAGGNAQFGKELWDWKGFLPFLHLEGRVGNTRLFFAGLVGSKRWLVLLVDIIMLGCESLAKQPRITGDPDQGLKSGTRERAPLLPALEKT